ncbi:hypothetical protein AVEN_206282-1 [Araneus ventricosus]|uniref:Uncharacterized protein n=1 Tax=Araneus ventricosus TaxID=182803 RepID=A0A4Y2U7X0_ARAVE|nr:hypothetical protein AVEN_206282-1 [Araneus ventricosus]
MEISVQVFLIVYRLWDTDRKYIPNDASGSSKEQGFRQTSTFAITGRNTKCEAAPNDWTIYRIKYLSQAVKTLKVSKVSVKPNFFPLVDLYKRTIFARVPINAPGALSSSPTQTFKVAISTDGYRSFYVSL